MNHRLRYQSRELLSLLFGGLESHFIYLSQKAFTTNHRVTYQSRELLSLLFVGLESQFIQFYKQVKHTLIKTKLSVQRAIISLVCRVGIPVYVVLIASFNYESQTEISVERALISLVWWVGIPVYLLVIVSFNCESQTDVSVQRVLVSLVCWVGILFYLGLMVSFYYRLKLYQSRELLSPLLAGLESQFVQL